MNSEAKRRANRRYHARNRDRRNVYLRAYRSANREKLNARQRERYAENHATRLAYARAYYADNAEQVKASVQANRAADPAKRNARERAWRERNRDEYRAKARLDAHRRRAAGQIDEDYAGILAGDLCSYCSAPFEQLDHIDAVTAGGSNHWTNLTAACQRCNSSKQVKPLLTYLLHRQEAKAA